MTDFPNLQEGKYEILSELGHNSLGGRVTYLAKQVADSQKVVIKQFQFAQLGTNWQEYETYEQELTMLWSLNHPSIPCYLDSFSTPNGFCLVQEYIKAVPLTTQYSWTPDSIRNLALAVLDILIYLQQQQPCIIHRDLKPENILIGEDEKVYLVDFGFARSGGGEVAVSSVVKGTLGFMPPEQLFNRQLTEAADLYGLGMTLICLLTGTSSPAVGSLIDANYYVHFRHLVPSGANAWLNWLEKLVEPSPQERFANAAEAKKALQEIDTTHLPKLRLNTTNLYLEAKQWGDKVTASIEVTNPIPDTLLAGRWEVAAHESDPPHTPYDHSWINVHPLKFSRNQQRCRIEVDTSNLLAGESYERQLIIHSNSSEDSRTVKLKVITPTLPKSPRVHYPLLIVVAGMYLLAVLLSIEALTPQLNSQFFPQLLVVNKLSLNWLFLPFSLGVLWGTPINDKLLSLSGLKKKKHAWLGIGLGAFAGTLVGAIFGFMVLYFGFIISIVIFSAALLLGTSSFRATIEKEIGNYDSSGFKVTNVIRFLLLLLGVLSSVGYFFVLTRTLNKQTLILIASTIFFASIYFNYIILKKIRVYHQSQLNLNDGEANAIGLFAGGLGATIGAGILAIYWLMDQKIFSLLNFSQQLLLIAIIIFPVITYGSLLSKLMVFKPRKIRKIISDYYSQEEQLIKP